MFKAIGWLIKSAIFAAIILILGNILHWGNRTVSDQVKVGLAHAERSDVGEKLKDWTSNTVHDAEDGIEESAKHIKPHPFKKIAYAHYKDVSPSEEGESDEKLPSSERQKLRALIRELNSPTAGR